MVLIKNSIIKIVLIICFLLIPLSVSAETIILDETNLTSGNKASGIYVEENGNIFVVDDNKELWVINPSTGEYSRYALGGSNLADIAITPEGNVWWTDNTINFGFLDLTSNYTTFSLIYLYLFYDPTQPLKIGPVTYLNSTPWIASWDENNYGLFNVSGEEICLYKFPLGYDVNAADLIASGGYIWGIDWEHNWLFQFNPSSNRVSIVYPEDMNIGSHSNMVTDGNAIWWVEDQEDGRLFRLDIQTFGLSYYNLSEGIHPRNIFIHNGDVWFSDTNGGIGRLDTDLTSGNMVVDVNYLYDLHNPDPICTNFFTIEGTITPTTGNFDWGDLESTLTTPEVGLDYYGLPDGSEPYGIGIAENKVWVSDRGRQKLIRMQLEVDHNIFLPLLVK